MQNRNNILFLSNTVPPQMRKEVDQKNKDTMQVAAIAFQDKIIGGLEKNIGKPVTLFNMIPVSSFPKYYVDSRIEAGTFSHICGAEDYNVGFNNIEYIKRILISASYMRQFKNFFHKSQFDSLICYSANITFMAAIKKAKEIDPDIKTCLIIPDMPEFNDLSTDMSWLRKTYMKMVAAKTRSYIPYIDSFVYMTKQSADYFCAKKPFVIVEGIAEDKNYLDTEVCCTSQKIVLYTGTTNRVFGAMNLVEAFMRIPIQNYRLIICGCGDSDGEIRKCAINDNRIDFKGIVPHAEALKLQHMATVLVNPRKNTEEFTKYSFPSKNLEYLSSGTPMIAYRLDGIPAEYDAYTYYVEDNTISSFKSTLTTVLSKSPEELHAFGARAREFVLREKNNVRQGQKIIDMIEAIL